MTVPLTCFVFIVLFSKKITVLFKKATLQKTIVIVEEELDGIDTDDIGNLEDSPRFVFIDEECENLIVVNDGGKLTQNINQKKIWRFLIVYIDIHYVANAAGDNISSVTMWNIVNQFLLGMIGIVPACRI